MAPEDTYTRRVCAVLLADVTGYSALMGEDDERTARAIERLQAVTGGIVVEAGGRAEPMAGDSLLATFDSVTAAVDAALRIQRRLAEEKFAGRSLQVCIGVHYGDLLFRGDAAFGDAINVAARLRTLARPGTVCISEGVYRHVGRKVDAKIEDLGRQRLKNISGAVHVYLIVPEGAAGKPRIGSHRQAWLIGAAMVAVIGILGAAVARWYASSPGALPRGGPLMPPAAPSPAGTEEERRITLGVMLFKPLQEDVSNAWMSEVLRDGLNTQLSALSSVKVYSKEFIDFLITRGGLSEFEAATRLGINKMLSGSFVVVGGTIRIEMHVVDVASGVLEGSYTTVGRERDFLELQSRMALDTVARLNLPITPEERQTLLARRSIDVEALKLLLESEGKTVVGPAGPDSALPRWLAFGDSIAPPAAHAEGTADSEIRAVLERYREATESRAIDALGALYIEFPPEQQAAQQRYFDNVRDLRVTIDNIDIAVVGDEAVASYNRTDDFKDARTGRPMHVAVRLTKMLRRHEGTWKLVRTQ